MSYIKCKVLIRQSGKLYWKIIYAISNINQTAHFNISPSFLFNLFPQTKPFVQYELRLVASDNLNENYTTIVIHVNDVNDNPPVFDRPTYETQITEEDDRNLPKRVLQVLKIPSISICCLLCNCTHFRSCPSLLVDINFALLIVLVCSDSSSKFIMSFSIACHYCTGRIFIS